MIHLPRPSTSASSIGIDVLSRSSRPQQLPPSDTTPSCYRFGQTTLSDIVNSPVDEHLDSILSRLIALSQLLAIPAQFGKGDGQAWTHSTEHYPTLLRWKGQVPSSLGQVAELLDELSTRSFSGSEVQEAVHSVIGQTVCALTRYVAPTSSGIAADLTFDPTQDDGWISEGSETKARQILADLQTSTATPSHSALARGLLQDYIKPIFTEAASSSAAPTGVDPTTGRRKAPAAGARFVSHLDAHLGEHRFKSAEEDEGASNLAPLRFALVASDTLPAMLRSEPFAGVDRNEALGCPNVLGWCLANLKLECETDWTEAWPLMIPPLLTLLEHPRPHFRVRGSLLVHDLLSHPKAKTQEQRQILGKILRRTGIGNLLERALHMNLTYLHDSHAPLLLSYSIGALRELILLTTAPIVYHFPSAHHSLQAGEGGGGGDECGQQRLDSLSRLISEGVLSTWSYLPLPPSGSVVARQIVDVTCQACLVIADDLATVDAAGEGGKNGLGAVNRFVDVSLDWIFRSWLSTLSFNHAAEVQTTLHVLELAKRLLLHQDEAGKRWTSLILASMAKCCIAAQESSLIHSEHVEWQCLYQSLSGVMDVLRLLDASVQSRWEALVEVDSRLGKLSPQ